ncbi:unnamed protein product [Pylaiella littoralis]
MNPCCWPRLVEIGDTCSQLVLSVSIVFRYVLSPPSPGLDLDQPHCLSRQLELLLTEPREIELGDGSCLDLLRSLTPSPRTPSFCLFTMLPSIVVCPGFCSSCPSGVRRLTCS